MSLNKYSKDEEKPLLFGRASPNLLYNSSSPSLNHEEIVIVKSDGIQSKFSKNVRNIILAILNVLFNVGINVTLPIYAGTMDKVGSDAYVLLSQACIFFVILFVILTEVLHYTVNRGINLKPTASYKVLFLMGLFTTLNGVLVVYASPPNRTPPYLQGLLTTTSIPFTVICRLVWLRKGINVPRSICVGSVLVGMFITAMPQLWGLPGSDSSGGDNHQSLASRILWPLCFTMGFLPYGIMNVICEKELKKGEGGSLSFITWSQVFQMFTMYPMFWTDFIPGFGMADSVSDFSDRMRIGWKCLFSSAEMCYGLPFKAFLFFVAYILGNLFQFLLIQYAEGAIYASIVQAIISPMAALFWTLFKFDVDSNRFFWGPKVTETTGFTAVGVCIIVPSVMLYNYFSVKEEEEKNAQSLNETDSI